MADRDPDPPRRLRRDAQVNYERTAIEYELLVRNGVRNPAVWIAHAHGVSPSTARVWVLRSKRAGYIDDERSPE